MTEQTDILRLVLNELDLSPVINTMNDRIEIQKAVCMVQESGLQLGYSYNWYVRGPYSPALASDYYALAQTNAEATTNLVLTEFAKSVVAKIKPAIEKPDHFPLNRVYWLELLASILYLRKRMRLSDQSARVKIEQSKPALHPYFESANNTLSEMALL